MKFVSRLNSTQSTTLAFVAALALVVGSAAGTSCAKKNPSLQGRSSKDRQSQGAKNKPTNGENPTRDDREARDPNRNETREQCDGIPALANNAVEVTVDGMVTGAMGRLKLTFVQAHIGLVKEAENAEKPKKAGVRYSTRLVGNDGGEKSENSTSIECKDFAQIPEAEITGQVRMPLGISRADGKMQASSLMKLTAFGTPASGQDAVVVETSAPDYATFADLKRDMDKHGTSGLFKISESQFEIRWVQESVNNQGLHLKITGRATYELLEAR